MEQYRLLAECLLPAQERSIPSYPTRMHMGCSLTGFSQRQREDETRTGMWLQCVVMLCLGKRGMLVVRLDVGCGGDVFNIYSTSSLAAVLVMDAHYLSTCEEGSTAELTCTHVVLETVDIKGCAELVGSVLMTCYKERKSNEVVLCYG